MSETKAFNPFDRDVEWRTITVEDEKFFKTPPKPLVILVPVEIEEDLENDCYDA